MILKLSEEFFLAISLDCSLNSIVRKMFCTKLFLGLALLLLIGQPLSANRIDDVVSSPGNDFDHKADAEEVADHVNYILTTDKDNYVGMGPVNRPQQHLQIIAIIAHLKETNEKPIHFQSDTAKYEKPADRLLDDRVIGVIKIQFRLLTARDALRMKALLYRVQEEIGIHPSLNSEVPLPNLEQCIDPVLFEGAKREAMDLIENSLDLDHLPIFDWTTVEWMAADAIANFKRSKLYAGDFINAKDVEKWVLDGAQP